MPTRYASARMGKIRAMDVSIRQADDRRAGCPRPVSRRPRRPRVRAPRVAAARSCARSSRRAQIPPHHVALVVPDDRLESYSASLPYARALLDALDELTGRGRGRRVGLGSSLGALALLHAHRLEARAFSGLFLQSGSFFRRRTDAQESRFPRFARVDRFVGSVLNARDERASGAGDDHLRARRGELRQQRGARPRTRRAGIPVDFHAARGGHDWATWRRAARGAPAGALAEGVAMRHLLGLVLGTEEDWPPAFEQLAASVGTFTWRGKSHELATERVFNEPFDLRYTPRYSLVVDRVGWWYLLPREWLKKIALMDDVYLLNNPFTFQSMEKHSAYCAMMRLGLKVPDTWLIPHKQPPWNERLPTTAARYNRAFDLHEIGEHGRLSALPEAVRRRPVARCLSGAQSRRAAPAVRRVGRAADARAVRGRGLRGVRAQPLDRRGDDGDVVRPRQAAARPLPGEARLPLAGAGPRGRDDLEGRQRVLPLGVQLVRVDRSRRRGLPDRLRERVARRRADEPALLLPLGDHRARALVRVLRCGGRRMRIDVDTRPWFEIADREDLSYEEKLRAYRMLADEHFQADAYAEFCAGPLRASGRSGPRVVPERRVRHVSSSTPFARRSRHTSTSSSSRTTAACSLPGRATALAASLPRAGHAVAAPVAAARPHVHRRQRAVHEVGDPLPEIRRRVRAEPRRRVGDECVDQAGRRLAARRVRDLCERLAALELRAETVERRPRYVAATWIPSPRGRGRPGQSGGGCRSRSR